MASSASATVGALAAGTDGYVLTADAAQTLGIKWAAASAGALTQINSQTLGSAASSVTFSSIPGTYTSLLLHGQARLDVAAINGSLGVQFNGDTAANYAAQDHYGTGTTSGALQATAQTSGLCAYVSANSATAGMATPFEVLIPFYANTHWHKATLGRDALRWATAGIENDTAVAHWASTAAITQVVLLASSGNILANSTFVLYGIT